MGRRTALDDAASAKAFSGFIVSMSKLEARRLVSGISLPTGVADSFDWRGDKDSWFNRWRQKFYQIVPFGFAFLRLIRDDVS